MVDYDRSTGSSGTMRIRDTGTYVEFWISAGNSTTFNHELPWRYTVNGVTSSWREYDYRAGSGFELLGRWNVTYDQTVTFYLGDSGTSGLGGPTTFSRFIDRTSVPSPPSNLKVTLQSATQAYVTFTDGANNGATIDSRQIGYGTSSSNPQTIASSDGSTTISGLAQGTTYYFWARTHNAKGYSGWSARVSIKTWSVPPAPNAVILSDIKQSSVNMRFTDNGDSGSPILEYQIAYGTNSTSPQHFVGYTKDVTIPFSGLNPGQTYYFWARVRNSAGWSPYSPVSTATLIAGAWIKIGSEWKKAVPYINDNGTWKVVSVWVKVAGTWRETL